jgi:uracil-DNA glycosylase
MSDDARRLIAQHAKTASLMGVDFLPLGEVPSALVPTIESQPVPTPTPTSESAPESEHKARSDSPTPIHAEPIGREALRSVYGSIAGAQEQLDALQAKYVQESPHRGFNTAFTKIVFGEGDAQADLMFIGEAPGEEEDRTGRPFVGAAGQLLEKMIGAMGFSRETVYITNVLKTRPTGNATPTGEEAALCKPYLVEQIRIVNPRVIVALGLSASQVLLGSSSPMRSLRGRWHPMPEGMLGDGESGSTIEIMATYHPAYLLRSYTQENRQKVWSDLTQVVEKLKADSE